MWRQRACIHMHCGRDAACASGLLIHRLQMLLFSPVDFLLPSSDTFVDLLPYLHTIHSLGALSLGAGAPPASRATPPYQAPYAAPSINQRNAPNAARAYQASAPPAAAAGANVWHRAPGPGAMPMSAPRPPPPTAYVPPRLTSVQQSFLRTLSTYHLHSYLDQLHREHAKANEALHAQMKREAAMGPAVVSAAELPTSGVLEAIEEIED
jgi:hypothetical protein